MSDKIKVKTFSVREYYYVVALAKDLANLLDTYVDKDDAEYESSVEKDLLERVDRL